MKRRSTEATDCDQPATMIYSLLCGWPVGLLLLFLLASVQGTFVPTTVSVSVSASVATPGTFDVTYTVTLGAETEGQDVQDIILFSRDASGAVEGIPTTSTLVYGTSSVIQYNVGFEPTAVFLMGATPGTLNGVAPDRPSVVVVTSLAFHLAVGGFKFSETFGQGEQGYTVPRLRDPSSASNLADMEALVSPSNTVLLADPFFLPAADSPRIVHFSCARPTCSPLNGGMGCGDTEACCDSQDCIAPGACSAGVCSADSSNAPSASPSVGPSTKAPKSSKTPKVSKSPKCAGRKLRQQTDEC